MKAIAINGSPKMDGGNTALVLNPFLEGMKEAGAEVEVLYTKRLSINPCQGDYICWLKTPGKCIHEDDMEMVLPKLAGADIWVFATPVYVDGMSGPMKNFIDRMLPLVEPFLCPARESPPPPKARGHQDRPSCVGFELWPLGDG